MEDSRFLVPIYLANIVLLKYSKTTNSEKLVEEVVLERIVIKGFTKEDIVKRQQDKIFKKALLVTKLSDRQYFKFKSIELLSQHGCGVNDYY